MIQKKTVIQLIDDWIERLGDGYADDVVETVLLIVKRKIEGLAEEYKWIPCSERLPEDRKEKLVYLSSDRITVAVYNEHRLPRSGYSIGWGYRVPDSYIDFEKETVIAWQPLPEPYKPPAPNWKDSMMRHFVKVE